MYEREKISSQKISFKYTRNIDTTNIHLSQRLNLLQINTKSVVQGFET